LLNVEAINPVCQDNMMQALSRRVHVYETDLMGIVHHSNYVRYCEEARVNWFLKNNILDTSNEAVFSLTVIDLKLKYVKSLKYGDTFNIHIQIKIDGVRLFIQYKIFDEMQNLCLLAETVHCSLDLNLKPTRINQKLKENILNIHKNNHKEMAWTETWL
jgi:acyl-CoA thioester hydrolase